MMLPFQILSMWFRGILSIALLVLGPWLVYRWYQDSHVTRPVVEARPVDAATPPRTVYVRNFDPHFGLDRETLMLAAGALMTLWALPKGPLASRRLLRRKGLNEPQPARTGEARTVTGAGGETIHVELYGPADAPPLVLTHGWGLNSTEWFYLKQSLAARYRLIVWDLPGLGYSTQPKDRDFSLHRLAQNLDRVIDLAGGRPAVLVGHSIGGMIMLTYAKHFPQALGTKVAGLVLSHTTFTNPNKTAKYAPLLTAIQTPITTPLCYLTIALSPLIRLMNILSYYNGSSHNSTERTSFSGNETRGQLDFATRFNLQAPPAVIARGFLGMMHYDASAILLQIPVPTLIVAGDKDPLTRPEASEHMHSAIPGSQLAILSPAKHMGLVEHHERYTDAITNFLMQLQQTPSTATARKNSYDSSLDTDSVKRSPLQEQRDRETDANRRRSSNK